MTNSIAERILKIRGTMKQADFAQALGINPNTLRSYENAKALPNQKILASICVKFSVNPEWLLLGTGQMRKSASVGNAPPAAQIDQSLLFEIIETLEEFIAQMDKELPPAPKAAVICQLYDLIAEKEPNENQPMQILRLIKGALAG